MNKIKRFSIFTAFSILILGLPAIASAQWRDRDDDYNRNGGYGNNGRYGNGQYGNYGDMRSLVRNLKQNARQLERQIDRELDRGRYNGSYQEDRINELARRFKNEVNGLGESNDSIYRRRDNRVERVLDLGQQMDRALSRARLSYNVHNLWSAIERDLQVLGRYSNYNNRSYDPNGNGRTGTGRNGLPSWWPF